MYQSGHSVDKGGVMQDVTPGCWSALPPPNPERAQHIGHHGDGNGWRVWGLGKTEQGGDVIGQESSVSVCSLAGGQLQGIMGLGARR